MEHDCITVNVVVCRHTYKWPQHKDSLLTLSTGGSSTVGHHRARQALPSSLGAHSLPTAALRLVGSVAIISVGVLLSGYGEISASFVGVVTMAVSITAESLRLVLMQFLMVRWR
jgi:hypothetical protein